MPKSAGHILKSDEVTLEGQFHLDVGQAPINRSPHKGSASTTPQVRILENNPEYAVIGIICSCGTEMSIRCDYAEARASGHPEA